MEIRFEGRLTEAEFRLCHSLMRPRVFRAWWILPVLVLTAVLVLRPYVSGIVRVGIALVVVYLLFKLWGERYWLRRIRRKHRDFDAPVKGTASESGIRWRVEGVSSNDVAWNAFERYVGTEDLILLYHAPNQALAVHRRYFPSLSGWNDFRRLLTERVPSKR